MQMPQLRQRCERLAFSSRDGLGSTSIWASRHASVMRGGDDPLVGTAELLALAAQRKRAQQQQRGDKHGTQLDNEVEEQEGGHLQRVDLATVSDALLEVPHWKILSTAVLRDDLSARGPSGYRKDSGLNSTAAHSTTSAGRRAGVAAAGGSLHHLTEYMSGTCLGRVEVLSGVSRLRAAAQ